MDKELKDFELAIKMRCLTAEFIDGYILNVKLTEEEFEYYSEFYDEYHKNVND